MQMTDGEIITAYRQAKRKAEQIQILAELNAVSLAEMEQRLITLGCLQGPLRFAQHKNPARTNGRIDEDRAMTLYAEGGNDQGMANMLGVSKSTVAAWRRRKGLKAHNPLKGKPRCGCRRKRSDDQMTPPLATEQRRELQPSPSGTQCSPATLPLPVSTLRQLLAGVEDAALLIDGRPAAALMVTSGSPLGLAINILTDGGMRDAPT